MNWRSTYKSTYSNIRLESSTGIIRQLASCTHLLQTLGHQVRLDHRLLAGSSLVLWHSIQIEYIDGRGRGRGQGSRRGCDRVSTGLGRTLPQRRGHVRRRKNLRCFAWWCLLCGGLRGSRSCSPLLGVPPWQSFIVVRDVDDLLLVNVLMKLRIELVIPLIAGLY